MYCYKIHLTEYFTSRKLIKLKKKALFPTKVGKSNPAFPASSPHIGNKAKKKTGETGLFDALTAALLLSLQRLLRRRFRLNG